MQQHPIPQNVTSYEFRLIGDMTIKQFGLLLAGGVVAFIFYSTNLISIFKWPLVSISLIMGAAFAFLPLEGRTLDKWMMAFIRAIYKPTQFHWKKIPTLPTFLQENGLIITPPTQDKTNQAPSSESERKKKGLNELITNTPAPTQTPEEIDPRINQINQLFSEPTTNAAPTPMPIKKSPPKVVAQKPTTPVQKSAQQNSVAGSIDVKPVKDIQIKKPAQEKSTQKVSQSISQSTSQPQPTKTQVEIKKPEKPKTSAFFNPKLPFPSLPETPNILVGMVYSKEGSIVDNAIIEIQKQGGHTVRATKTNKIGQFFLATPLPEGSYLIKIEKPQLTFQTISIKLENRIYPPLEIRATE